LKPDFFNRAAVKLTLEFSYKLSGSQGCRGKRLQFPRLAYFAHN
jgi:hypothetical protein